MINGIGQEFLFESQHHLPICGVYMLHACAPPVFFIGSADVTVQTAYCAPTAQRSSKCSGSDRSFS